MGLPNRTRDFTSDTWAEMMESLSGPTEESREFRDFWNNYGSCFDNLDLWNEAVMIDEFISRSRYLMSDLAPREFQRVYDRIHELDEAFGKDCENTVAEIQNFGTGIDLLTGAISGKGFPANFDKAKLDAKLKRFSVQVNSDKEAFIETIMDKSGLSRREAEQIWELLKTSDNRNWFRQKDFDNLQMGLSAGTIPFQPSGNPGTFFAELLYWLLVAGIGLIASLVDWDSVGGWVQEQLDAGASAQEIAKQLVLTDVQIYNAINDLENSNTKHHILQEKHGWSSMVPNPNDPNSWEKIKEIIRKVLSEGTQSVYNSNGPNNTPVFIKTLVINGKVVEVTYIVIDGIVRISNAWIKPI